MSRGRNSVIRALGAMWMILTVSAVDAQTPDARKPIQLTPVCRPPRNIHKKEALVKGGHVGEGGKVHFTFRIEPDADPKQAEAFGKAVEQWNNLSTWMKLEPSTSGRPDIKFGEGSIDYYPDGKTPIGYCGKHDPDDSSVRYHPSRMKFAADHPFAAAKIYAHEIGHVLGLDHSPDGSLMDETPYRGTGDCKIGSDKARELDAAIDRAALHCAFAIHYRNKKVPEHALNPPGAP